LPAKNFVSEISQQSMDFNFDEVENHDGEADKKGIREAEKFLKCLQ